MTISQPFNTVDASSRFDKYQPNPRFFTAGNAYQRFLDEAPYLSRCSDDKTATRIRPRHIAVKYPYMQINRQDFVSWLVFDLDHPNAHIWADKGLPCPNFIVQNRQTGHSHLYYAIVPVCTSEHARIKPINYMRSIYAAFADKLDADLDFHSGPVAKTPGHSWWLTSEHHAHVYELGELADHVELAKYSFRPKPRPEDVANSRHCILFEKLRHYAYAMVANYRAQGYDRFFNAILSHAERLNSFEYYGFSTNLPFSSIKATSRSVARWTFFKYRGAASCNRGVMQLASNEHLSLPERQKLSAARTAALRAEKTTATILTACRRLVLDGTRVTQKAISEITKLSRQSISKYKTAIEKFLAGQSPAESTSDVKLGVRQVTAVPTANTQLTFSQSFLFEDADSEKSSVSHDIDYYRRI